MKKKYCTYSFTLVNKKIRSFVRSFVLSLSLSPSLSLSFSSPAGYVAFSDPVCLC